MFDLPGMIAGYLAKYQDLIMVVVMTVICTNVLLTAVKKLLGRFKDKTASDLDNKAYAFISGLLGYVDKALEFATANSNALPPAVKAELEKKD